MKNEFIYTVGEMFGRVLTESKLSQYYIGPYQRGYKWASQSIYDQVPQLLIDVYQAWQKSKSSGTEREQEYFLQYITVLRNEQENAYEVIDGQQRLTTLAIIFERIHARYPNINSIAHRKLKYSREDNSETLFDKIKALDEGTLDADSTQDLFYIHEAVKCIDKFLICLGDQCEKYAEFFLNSVKIILNRENDFVDPEDVFVNLNGNSVELTDSYLVKGLFLTRGINRTDSVGNQYSYSEIQEQRKINGRIWDEIQNWIEQPHIAHFFFGQEKRTKGMECLLELIRSCQQTDSQKGETNGDGVISKFKKSLSEINETQLHDRYQLFNQFNEIVQTDKDGRDWMKILVHGYKKLHTLYDSNNTYNLLGYVLFQKGKKRMEILNEILYKSSHSVNTVLANYALELLPDFEKDNSIQYPDKRLTPILLSLSVFPEGFKKDEEPRFDFPKYDLKKWTYEHIRPQNPKDESLKVPEYCRNTIAEMFRRKIRDEKLALLEEHLDSSPDIIKNELEKLSTSQNVDIILQKIESGQIDNISDFDFLYGDLENVDVIGNMALLSSEVNSSVSNNPYIVKRSEIIKKHDDGEFIPSHTLAVFSKVLNVHNNADHKEFSPEQTCWGQQDVDTHTAWIYRRNKEIRNQLSKLIENK